jgi:hypothetical protein
MFEMSKEIDVILDVYHSARLWEMADAAGLEVTDRHGKKLTKAKLLPLMRAKFFDEARVRASWQQLSKQERAVLNRLLLHREPVATKSFRRETIRASLATPAPQPERPKGPSYYYRHEVPYADGYTGDHRHKNSTVFEDIIARLTYRGLVFSQGTPLTTGSTPYKLQFHPGTTLYVPDVVRQHLPEPEPVPSGISGWQPARVETGAPTTLLRDLYLYWDAVRRNEVSLIQAGFVGKRWLKEINKALLVPDPLLEDAQREDETGRLYLLRQLLESLGLIQKDRGCLCPTGKDALHIPPFWSQAWTEQVQACLAAWSRSGGHAGLGSSANVYNPRYAYARRIVLNALKTLTPEVWWEIEDLVERVEAQDTDFLFPEHSKIENSRSSWYYSYSGSYYANQRETLLKTFGTLEDRFIHNCLAGFLFQLGLVELGYGQDNDTLQGFRLVPESRTILSNEPSEQISRSPSQVQDESDRAHLTGKLIVQPTFQLLAIGPVSLALLAQLDLFADRERADQGAFEYRLSRESVYRAQQLGMDAVQVIRFLEQASETELPQNVRRSLDEWAAHHERIVFRTGVSLLQAANAGLLNTLMEQTDTGQFIARSVSPQVALVRTNQQPQLISTLIAQGVFPAVSGAQPEAADGNVIIQEDGTIHPIHAVPSLHLRGRLSRVAEEADDGGWRLTPASVSRAGGSQGKVLRLLEELSKLHRGQLPETLVEQIKAWGGYYGNAAVETLTLIEFRDQSALDELRRHPELHKYLAPFPAGNRAFAVVQADKLTHVKKILDHFGVRIKDGIRRD